MDLKIEGMKEFIDTIDRLVKNVSPEKIEPVLFREAQRVSKEVRANAPVGPTGNLKKAVITKRLQRWGRNPAPSIAAINRKKAPHAWLVIHGTSGVRAVDPPHYVNLRGRMVKITNTGIMPPNRFFQNAIEAKKDEVLYRIENAVGKLMEDGMK